MTPRTGDVIETAEAAEDYASRHYEDMPHHKQAAREGFVAGAKWQAEQEPTDAEIEAAARALCWLFHRPGFDAAWMKWKDEFRTEARTMLQAAKEARK